MKMNDKIKSQFQAQYLGQPFVYQYTDLTYSDESISNVQYLSLWNTYTSTLPVLLLRSVEQLTTDEKFMIREALNVLHKELHFKYTKKRADFEYAYYAPILENDILKSLGVLVQFSYLNDTFSITTLQPSEIIELGWAKL